MRLFAEDFAASTKAIIVGVLFASAATFAACITIAFVIASTHQEYFPSTYFFER